jgi:hypothetical protein
MSATCKAEDSQKGGNHIKPAQHVRLNTTAALNSHLHANLTMGQDASNKCAAAAAALCLPQAAAATAAKAAASSSMARTPAHLLVFQLRTYAAQVQAAAAPELNLH